MNMDLPVNGRLILLPEKPEVGDDIIKMRQHQSLIQPIDDHLLSGCIKNGKITPKAPI
jgi:hypothetical protein